MQYRPKVTVEAEQFLGPDHPIPRGMKLWPDERGMQPRDMSWGYISGPNGREHVQRGDWVIHGLSVEPFLCRRDDFEQRYELLNA